MESVALLIGHKYNVHNNGSSNSPSAVCHVPLKFTLLHIYALVCRRAKHVATCHMIVTAAHILSAK